MKLIVNSDDFGYSRGHNYGIVDCYLAGILTATTLMNNQPATEQAYALAKEHPGLDVGIHFVLTHGRPLAPAEKIPSLVNEDGSFLCLDDLREGIVNPEEVYYEWSLQLARQIDNGILPSHADSHHHVHMAPELFPIFCRLAAENNLAIRFFDDLVPADQAEWYAQKRQQFKQADLFRGDFYAEKVSFDYFKTLPLREDISVEVMAHPAYLDQRINQTSSYNLERVMETAVLTDPALKEFLVGEQVKLISFKDL